MTYYTKFLGKIVTVIIDRPLGSKHPKNDLIYAINYGYLENTKAPDGEEIDAYVLGMDIPINEFTGKCIAVIHRLNDDDDKLVVVSENKTFSDEEIRNQTHFQEQYFKSKIIR